MGTPEWSSEVHAPLAKPLDHPNLMYSYHLYTGDTHYEFKPKLDLMRTMGLPVFVTEWGVSRDKESGELDLQEARDFIDYMRENQLSWANWSLSNKDEDFSLLLPHVTKMTGWTEEDLTESGRLILEILKNGD